MQKRLRHLLIALVLAALAVGGSAALAATPAAETAGAGSEEGEELDPCGGPFGDELLCPDLRVGPAFDLYVQRGGYGSYGRRTLLRAGNDIKSRGSGPLELRGRRFKPDWMRVNQAIYVAGGGVRVFQTEAKLHYFDVGPKYGGAYWKAYEPLTMEIWSLDSDRQPLAPVRLGPKLFYCFRDLERTKPMRTSPPKRVYGGCNQDPSRQHVRLGTSVGWSDIYPSTYHRQWVDVSGLRGCFAFVMEGDPHNYLYEEHEGNNRSVRVFRLPYRDGPQRC